MSIDCTILVATCEFETFRGFTHELCSFVARFFLMSTFVDLSRDGDVICRYYFVLSFEQG